MFSLQKQRDGQQHNIIISNNCSPTMCQMSHVICQVSGVRCQVSGVRCQVSGVRCQVSGVIIIIFFFFSQCGGTSRWRVCYQRVLPRLVPTPQRLQNMPFIAYGSARPSAGLGYFGSCLFSQTVSYPTTRWPHDHGPTNVRAMVKRWLGGGRDGQQPEQESCQDCHHPHGGRSETDKTCLAETSLVGSFRIYGYLQTSEDTKAEGVKMYTQQVKATHVSETPQTQCTKFIFTLWRPRLHIKLVKPKCTESKAVKKIKRQWGIKSNHCRRDKSKRRTCQFGKHF